MAFPQFLQTAALGARRISQHEQILRLFPVHVAIDAMRASTHRAEDFQAISTAINLVEAVGRTSSVVRHFKDWVDHAQATVCAAFFRQRDTGSNVFTPQEIATFCAVQHDFAQVLDVLTNRELFEAEKYMLRRLQQAKVGQGGGVMSI